MARPKKVEKVKMREANVMDTQKDLEARIKVIEEKERLLAEKEKELAEFAEKQQKVTELEDKMNELVPVNAVVTEPVREVKIEDMPLTSLREYRQYNNRARAANKSLRMCRYPIEQCPVELHPTQRVVFNRNDQPENALPIHVSNHLIHFEKTLLPGQTYDLPLCIISHLESKGVPVWKWVDKPDGTRETVKSHSLPRFGMRTIFESEEG